MEAAAVWYKDQYDQYDVRPFKLLAGLCPCTGSWLPHQNQCQSSYKVKEKWDIKRERSGLSYQTWCHIIRKTRFLKTHVLFLKNCCHLTRPSLILCNLSLVASSFRSTSCWNLFTKFLHFCVNFCNSARSEVS